MAFTVLEHAVLIATFVTTWLWSTPSTLLRQREERQKHVGNILLHGNDGTSTEEAAMMASHKRDCDLHLARFVGVTLDDIGVRPHAGRFHETRYPPKQVMQYSGKLSCFFVFFFLAFMRRGIHPEVSDAILR
jgi:hypothetical protein